MLNPWTEPAATSSCVCFCGACVVNYVLTRTAILTTSPPELLRKTLSCCVCSSRFRCHCYYYYFQSCESTLKQFHIMWTQPVKFFFFAILFPCNKLPSSVVLAVLRCKGFFGLESSSSFACQQIRRSSLLMSGLMGLKGAKSRFVQLEKFSLNF